MMHPHADPNDHAHVEEDEDLVVHSIDDASDVLPEELEAMHAGGEQAAALRAELDEAIAARARVQADFQNYQRRSIENEARARRDGTGAVVRSLMGVVDHFDLALEQSPDMTTTEQLLDGLRMVRGELIKALEQHAVQVIRPESGDPFEPEHHQAVFRQPTDEFPPNTIVQVIQVGFLLRENVLRPANVVVAVAPEVPADDADAPSADEAGEAEGETHADV